MGDKDLCELTKAAGKSYNIAVVLGGCEVKLEEHVQAYSTFGRAGVAKPQAKVLRVESSTGEVVKEWKDDQAEQVLNPEIAWLMSDILSDDDARSGTFGRNSRQIVIPGIKAAAKTGTTNRNAEGWMMGYTPKIAAGVLVDRSDHGGMNGITSRMTGPIYTDFMREVYKLKGWKSEDFFERPAGIQKLTVDGRTDWFQSYFKKPKELPSKEFTVDNYEEGVQYLKNHPLPIVMKADGLAAGKGVVICENHLEAIAEFELMIQRAKFGEAGKRVVIEQFLQGVEMSVFVLMDGKNYVILPEAKDYKRIGEGDTGPNTGGMGAVSPVPFADKVLMKKIEEKVIKPTVDGLQKEGLEYRGFIFFGFMIVKDEPYMIEYNCRMGDPETEVVIPRLKNDLVELFAAVATQQLDKIKIETDPRTACTVVAVSGGYPGEYEKGHIINGLDDINPTDSMLFHMGTTEEKGKIVTSGGRVFCITSYGKSVFDAVEISKDELRKVSFTEMNYRTDIGYEFP
jgi:phosphoribosylamine--glycine ligase